MAYTRVHMRRLTSLLPLAALLATAACAGKPTVDDDFSSFSGLDQKSDSFSYRMTIVGSLDYNAAAAAVPYTHAPRYRAVKFGGREGDAIDVWVRSADGDAVAWVLDNRFRVLGSNDDADATTLDAHIALTLPASKSETHYIVIRDYALTDATFDVELAGPTGYSVACAHDEDCAAVSIGGCCPDGTLVAVNTSSVDDYATATACTIPQHACPEHIHLDTRVAECDAPAGVCGMVEIADIACGAHSTNSHGCPVGYTCNAPGTDAAGHCVANQ